MCYFSSLIFCYLIHTSCYITISNVPRLSHVEPPRYALQEAVSEGTHQPENNMAAVSKLLQFCSRGTYDYESNPTLNYPTPSKAHQDAAVYILADKYDIQSLKELATARFSAVVNECLVSDLPSLISLVYSKTSEPDCALRKAIVRYAFKQWRSLSPIPDLIQTIAENPSFALDLINAAYPDIEEKKPNVGESMSIIQGISESLINGDWNEYWSIYCRPFIIYLCGIISIIFM